MATKNKRWTPFWRRTNGKGEEGLQGEHIIEVSQPLYQVLRRAPWELLISREGWTEANEKQAPSSSSTPLTREAARDLIAQLSETLSVETIYSEYPSEDDESLLQVVLVRKEKDFSVYRMPIYTDEGYSDMASLVWEIDNVDNEELIHVWGPSKPGLVTLHPRLIEVAVGKLDWVTEEVKAASRTWRREPYEGYEKTLQEMLTRAETILQPKAYKLFADNVHPGIMLEAGGEGRSQIGGMPDLPVDTEWPFDDGVPYFFMGQIDLGEIPNDFPREALEGLPTSGLLSFFYLSEYDVDMDVKYTKPSQEYSNKVFYFPEGSNLVQRPFPEQMHPNHQYKAFAVQLVARPNLPDIEFPEGYFDVEDGTNDVWWKLGQLCYGLYSNGEDEYHCLLGNALMEQMPLNRAGVHDIPSEDIRLLAQFSSDDNTEMCWGDLGNVYFAISQQDLEALNLDGVQTYMDCG